MKTSDRELRLHWGRIELATAPRSNRGVAVDMTGDDSSNNDRPSRTEGG